MFGFKRPAIFHTPRGVQLATHVKVVSDDDAKRLEEKRKELAYRPETGFLLETKVERVR